MANVLHQLLGSGISKASCMLIKRKIINVDLRHVINKNNLIQHVARLVMFPLLPRYLHINESITVTRMRSA